MQDLRNNQVSWLLIWGVALSLGIGLSGCGGGPDKSMNNSVDEPRMTSAAPASFVISDSDLEERGFASHWVATPAQGSGIENAWFLGQDIYRERRGEGGRYFLEKIDGETGRLSWSFSLEGKLEHRPEVYRYSKELQSSRDSEIFFVQHVDDAGEFIFCLDDTYGAENYRIDCGFPVSTPVTAAQDHIFVGSWNYRMYAINKSTKLEESSYITEAPITAPAEAGGLNVYVGGEDNIVYSLNQGAAYVPDSSWRRATGGKIVSQPLFYNGRLYVSSWDYKVYCLEEYQGITRWGASLGAPVRQRPFAFSDWIFAVTESEPLGGARDRKFNLVALDQGSGQIRWENDDVTRVLGADNFHCYAIDGDKMIHALRLDDGVEAWSIDVSKWDHVLGQDADKGAARERLGRIYLVSRSGTMQCIRPRR